MKCDNCDNQATMHKHYEKSDGTFADSYLCDRCFGDEFCAKTFYYDVCAWCGKEIKNDIFFRDKQNRKYCNVDCMKRFMGYEDE